MAYRSMRSGRGVGGMVGVSLETSADYSASVNNLVPEVNASGLRTGNMVPAPTAPAPAPAPSFYGSNMAGTIRCLYDTNGSYIRSLYARDPQTYGRGGPRGTPVCYRSKTTAFPPRLPVPKSSRYSCLSIYDIYNRRVCYYPTVPAVAPPVAPTDPTPILSTTAPTDPQEIPQVSTTDDYPEVPYADPPIDGGGVPEDTTPIFPQEEPVVDIMPPPAPETGIDKKTLLIGGIIAAVAVGGIAIAVASRKK